MNNAIDSFKILIDTTNGCNLRCVFCCRDSNKVVRMTTSEFELILDRLRGRISSLQLCCAWEYSIAKNAPEIVTMLGEQGIQYTTIYSNGVVLSDALAEAIINAQIGIYVFSIGEATKETYENLRVGGNFEKVLANIMKLARMKEERYSIYPRLAANATLINSNITELVAFVDLAHLIGIEVIRGRHLILLEGMDMEDEIIRDRIHANNVIEDTRAKAAEYGMTFSIPSYAEQPIPKECHPPWNQLYIASNGDVAICPRISQYSTIGNLICESLEHVLESREMKDLTHQFDKGEYSNPVCGICIEGMEAEVPIDQGF